MIAYRTWRVRRDGRLYSVGLGLFPWLGSKPHSAVCWKNFLPIWRGTHVAPGYDCTCGIYGWTTPDDHPHEDAASFGAHVRGIIKVWGKVVVHEKGLRAEHALPVAIEAGPHSAAVASRYGLLVLADEREY